MSFNNLGPLTFLAPGGAHYWWYDRGGGDYGFQHAAADIKTPNGGDRLDATDQGKRKYNSGYTQYYVTIKDVDAGTSGTWYNLQGGGAV
jgi:hypothetical protein